MKNLFFLALLLKAAIISNAYAQSKAPAGNGMFDYFVQDGPPAVISISEIEHSPAQLAFWKSIQKLLERRNVQDFNWIVGEFQLSITEPIDVVNVGLSSSRRRDDFHGPYLGKSSYYWYIPPGSADGTLGLRLEIDKNLMCLPRKEVIRVFGQPKRVSVGSHATWWVFNNPVGHIHGIGYSDSENPSINFGFDVAPSGCISSLSINESNIMVQGK